MPIPVGKKRNSAHAAKDFNSDTTNHPVVLITGASSGFGDACARHLCTKWLSRLWHQPPGSLGKDGESASPGNGPIR
jgi:hypothetical protein